MSVQEQVTPVEALRQFFGLTTFRAPQETVVESILSGRDTIVVMPTGGGKSLCYQLPALLLDGVTLVVSPLIALMKDQVDALNARELPAAMINSSLSRREQYAVIDGVRAGRYRLVYVAPERFRDTSFVEAIGACRVAQMAIDEAHCISQWGHDFRPDYMRLGQARKRIGNPPCSAFTATATPEVRQDIVSLLELRDPAVFVSGFERPNLSMQVRTISRQREKLERIRTLVNHYRTGIVYCATRKSVEKVSGALTAAGVDHTLYHGGLTDQRRTEAQERFLQQDTDLVVATNAFGMGIDRADIRFVAHYELPDSVEAYYQEAGRAGRDGHPAICELLFMYADKRIQDFFIEGSNPDADLVKTVYGRLRNAAEETGDINLTVDELTASLPGRPNPMAVSTAMGLLRRAGLIERFDIPGTRRRGTRIIDSSVTPAFPFTQTELAEKKARDENKLKQIIGFAYTQSCRQKWILRYFGETEALDCARCDNCRLPNTEKADLTEEQALTVKKVLSGIARMSYRRDRDKWKGRYGRGRIIKCLRGSRSQETAQAGADRLPTWGILSSWREDELRGLFSALEKAGLIETDDGDYPLVTLTPDGSRVMTGRETARVVWPVSSRSAPTATECDETLYANLVEERNRIRQELGGIPAYRVFPNSVLEQLASRKPLDRETACAIPGIGPAKAKNYLPSFLRVIRDHVAD